MEDGYFTLDGVSSKTIGLLIQDRPVIESPTRRVSFQQSFGQSGDTPFDHAAYDNTKMELLLLSENHTGSASDAREKVHYFFDSGKYMRFIPYFDEGKIYSVMATSFPKFTTKYYLAQHQIVEVVLTVKPYKLLVNAPVKTMTAAGSLVNPTLRDAAPVIKVYGTGNVTLTINGTPFVIKNIVDHITIDSSLQVAYKDVSGVITDENSKIYTRKFPGLKSGTNSISWTGTVSKIEIDPRWRTLA